MESILTSIKDMLEVHEEDAGFDIPIIAHINTALFRLKQLGVGPSTGFSISSDEKTWSDFLGDDVDYEPVKTYIYCKVKLIFDPPQSSSAVEVLKETVKELEFCLNAQAETEVI